VRRTGFNDASGYAPPITNYEICCLPVYLHRQVRHALSSPVVRHESNLDLPGVSDPRARAVRNSIVADISISVNMQANRK